jgi:hypothetical protein
MKHLFALAIDGEVFEFGGQSQIGTIQLLFVRGGTVPQNLCLGLFFT